MDKPRIPAFCLNQKWQGRVEEVTCSSLILRSELERCLLVPLNFPNEFFLNLLCIPLSFMCMIANNLQPPKDQPAYLKWPVPGLNMAKSKEPASWPQFVK